MCSMGALDDGSGDSVDRFDGWVRNARLHHPLLYPLTAGVGLFPLSVAVARLPRATAEQGEISSVFGLSRKGV